MTTLAGATACVGVIDDPLARIIVQDAHLGDVGLSNVAAVVGGGGGSADLVVNDVDGFEHLFPCTLTSTELGLVLDGSVLLTWGLQFAFEVIPGERNARELVGKYEGPHVGGNIVLGGHYRQLEHTDTGVPLNITALSAGVGFVPVAWEQLSLALVDDPIVIGNVGFGPPLECEVDEDCLAPEACNTILGVCEEPGVVQRLPTSPIDRAPRGPPDLP